MLPAESTKSVCRMSYLKKQILQDYHKPDGFDKIQAYGEYDPLYEKCSVHHFFFICSQVFLRFLRFLEIFLK